jgi:hypothetical protein
MSQIQPPPAAYFSPTHSQAVADFFGAPPPPYSEPLPEYKQHDTSLARYMFKYGFCM